MNDEIFLFDDVETDDKKSSDKQTWKILIVDDEPEIHTVTKMVLSEFKFAQKSLEFISAYSGKEAMTLMATTPDISLIFLDVVMEEDDSGLKVVRYIREDLNNFFVRIILRTGQPGQAPEERVITEYDINDYKEKTELTSRKLFTTTMASLRSYRDLMRIESNRKGLEKIIKSSNDIGKFKSMNDFIAGVLIQLTSILGLGESAFYCQMSSFAASRYDDEFYILSATGEYTQFMNRPIHSVLEKNILTDLDHAIINHRSEYYDDRIVLYIKTGLKSEHLIYLDKHEKLDNFDIELIEIFISNVAVAYDNMYLNIENEETQREIIFELGELTEVRCKSEGKHVKRVAEYCRLLAQKWGLSDEQVDYIYLGSTMHDVGKIAVPDSILNKPTKLSPEEFEIMKGHAAIGYDMLKKSNRDIMKTAAIIAHQHHEKFDGSGYPQGLKGEDISIAGRIAAVADVFDALGTVRPYKHAWDLQDILDLMKRESGTHFDPKLIAILFDDIEDFMHIRTEFMDTD